MTRTIVAIYDDMVIVQQVIKDLVMADFAPDCISLMMSDMHGHYSPYLDKAYPHTATPMTIILNENVVSAAFISLLMNTLVDATALTIPGIGSAIAAGPIVTDINNAIVGGLPGAVLMALVNNGITEEDAPYYAEGIYRGGTLITLQADNLMLAGEIINRHGAINIHERADLWQQTGWRGFDVVSIENDETATPPADAMTVEPNLRVVKRKTQA